MSETAKQRMIRAANYSKSDSVAMCSPLHAAREALVIASERLTAMGLDDDGLLLDLFEELSDVPP